ncbi:MAG: bile acid:sodium symporter family protein [Sphingobacterium sp.]
MRGKFDTFIIALFVFILLAYFSPQLYLWGQGKVLSSITLIGVSLIFFFYGLKLSLPNLKSGLRNWRMHLVIQGATFVLFPLLVLLFYPMISSSIQEDFWLSFFFLATVPSTVSSSVVMVSIAQGNISSSIFNASVSGLIGVAITPLWMQFFLDFGHVNVLMDVYWGLIKEIIIPVIVGLLLQPYLGEFAMRHSKGLANFDKLVILLIVYGSFAESFVSGVFNTVEPTYLAGVFVGVVAMFVMVYGVLYWLSTAVFHFNLEDRITVLFCGSKKSLTHGTVFGKFLFVNSSAAGLYFLPLMIFHAFQILVITFIAQRYARKKRLV